LIKRRKTQTIVPFKITGGDRARKEPTVLQLVGKTSRETERKGESHSERKKWHPNSDGAAESSLPVNEGERRESKGSKKHGKIASFHEFNDRSKAGRRRFAAIVLDISTM